MIICLEGENATGKTTLAYTGPLKVVGFAFDLGFERALFGSQHGMFKGLSIDIVPYEPEIVDCPKFVADITIFKLPQPIQVNDTQLKGCTLLWNYFLIRYVGALQDPEVKTVVVDTATLARRVKADSHLEELQKIAAAKGEKRTSLIQIEWGRPNDATRDLYTTPESMGKNMIAIHHLTDERKDMVGRDGKIEQGALTGNRILEGFSQTYRFVDVALRMKKTGGAVKGEWVKCGYNLVLEGTEISDPTWDKLVDVIEMSTAMKIERRNGSS